MDTSDLGLLLLRVVIGLTFAAHGAQKLFGWWGGAGWDGWQAVMVRLGFRPAALFAAISVAAEVGGGLLFAVGFLTPLAGLVLIGQEVVIIAKSHWARGFWNRDNGFEFPLALFAGTVAIVLTGPGGASVDAQLGISADAALRIGLVALGILGGLATAGLPEMARRDDTAAARR
ncbi:MAG TPA: DoxX family protein [Candidatus Limnocylindrales bacterium]|jgi:putative oxidoreductase|nr:DoxX family protein [Candidatus Limnocylindrales bacterium]